MLEQYHLQGILFLDIETVPQTASFDELSETGQALWEKKSARFRQESQTAKDVYAKAGIYAEFGKVVCISVGMMTNKSDRYGFRIKSFYGHDEYRLLADFCQMLEKFNAREHAYLCAHNGRDFDFPFIIRRLLINALAIPDLLNVVGKKPWEVPFLDTLELWKFGDHRHYASLDLLAYALDIPTPKDDIDGSMVGEVYYQEDDLERIVRYCEKDTLAVGQLFLRYRGQELIATEDVEYAGE